MTNDETVALRVTVIGGQSYADDFTVIWRGLPIRQDHARARSAAARPAMALDLQRLRQARWRWRIRRRPRRLQAPVSSGVVDGARRANGTGHRAGARLSTVTPRAGRAGRQPSFAPPWACGTLTTSIK